MADTSNKPSWLADLLGKNSGGGVNEVAPAPQSVPTAPIISQPAPAPAPTSTTTPSWETSVTLGKGTLADDPMSGSIMRLLDENGFRQKIESGAKSGHSFTIIHNAPSTEFLLIDSWDENGTTRKNYQAFTIKQTTPSTQPDFQEPIEPHPLLVSLRELDADLDRLLTLTKRFA